MLCCSFGYMLNYNVYTVYVCRHVLYIFLLHPLVDTQASFISWLLSLMLQWTLGCIYLFKLVFLFSSDKNPEMELLDNMVVLFLFFWGDIVFHRGCTKVHSHTNSTQRFPFLLILVNIFYFLSLWWQPFWQVWGDISYLNLIHCLLGLSCTDSSLKQSLYFSSLSF